MPQSPNMTSEAITPIGNAKNKLTIHINAVIAHFVLRTLPAIPNGRHTIVSLANVFKIETILSLTSGAIPNTVTASTIVIPAAKQGARIFNKILNIRNY
jgi:hypothetical protein